MSRVVWTNIEKQLVTERMVALLRHNPGWSNHRTLEEAQQVLPYERRIVVTHSRVHSHKPKIEAARKRAQSLGKPVEVPAPTNVAPEPPKREETPTERLAGVLDALLDIVADKLADRIAERLTPPMNREQLHAMVNEQFDRELERFAPRPRHNPEPRPTPKANRPGVLVLGLLPQTGEQMRREFGDRLDIEWYDSDDATTRQVHPMAHVVLMTRFINHSIQERWRKAGHLHYCNGGASQLWGVLDHIVAYETRKTSAGD